MTTYTRDQIGLRPPRGRSLIPRPPAPNFWVHYVGSTMPAAVSRGDVPAEMAQVRSIQSYHLDRVPPPGEPPLADIEYSFLVGQSGSTYEGRGWGVVGGHTGNQNSTSHAVCWLGGPDDVPTEAAITAIIDLIRYGQAAGYVGNGVIDGHRFAPTNSTECPGEAMIERLDEIRSRVASGAGPAQEDDMYSDADRKRDTEMATLVQLSMGTATEGQGKWRTRYLLDEVIGVRDAVLGLDGDVDEDKLADLLRPMVAAAGSAGLSEDQIVAAVKRAGQEGTG